MTISEKMEKAETSTWLVDAFTEEEIKASDFIALIAVSIQQHRMELGMTQREFARKLGVSQAMVSQWENGEKNFTVATLVRIASALGLSLRNPIRA